MNTICAGGVTVSTSASQAEGGGSSPAPALQSSVDKGKLVVRPITQDEARPLLEAHHSLSKIGGFRSGPNYGLVSEAGHLWGVCIFTGFPVPELAVGMLGLPRSESKGLFELSRFCLSPEIQGKDKNIGSWFLSRAIRRLRSATSVRVILSYADADYHNGGLYRACNFGYFGLSAAKNDWWTRQPDGSYKKSSRGKTGEGEWRPRSRKHRFVMLFDRALSIKWEKVI